MPLPMLPAKHRLLTKFCSVPGYKTRVFLLAGIAFVIAVILIASIWRYLRGIAEHERQRAGVLAGAGSGL